MKPFSADHDVTRSTLIQVEAEVPEVGDGGFAGFSGVRGREIIFHNHRSASAWEANR
jgi:hypothetical protein